MKVGSKLPYEELQVKFDFRHGWPTCIFFMSYCPLLKIRFPDFYWLCFHVSEWNLVASICMRLTNQVRLSLRLTYFFMGYCPLFKIRFPDFSQLSFHISEWKLIASFRMKSYRSSSIFVTVDLLFYELLPFVWNSFSGLFSALLSHIWVKVGIKLLYEELQINFDFRHGWPIFSWVNGRMDGVILAVLY